MRDWAVPNFVMTCYARPLRWAAGVAGIVSGVYLSSVALTWIRYGQAARRDPQAHESLLDTVMPEYDVREQHHLAVCAPVEVAFEAAMHTDLMASNTIRAIFRTRELLLGATDASVQRRGLLELMQSLGWAVLAGTPQREIVMGSVTQPWHQQVIFHPLEAPLFRAFKEPGFVKIAWTIRADADARSQSRLSTETRVSTTDPSARRMFRRYWSFFSPGIVLIRRILLRQVKREAERLAARRTA